MEPREQELRSRLERAVVAMLRPLVRLLMKRGISHGEFNELVKRAFVESARDDFQTNGGRQTRSRIATLTGLTRKEVARLLDSDGADEVARVRVKVNRAARVVSAWVGDPEFRDGRNMPASLPLESEEAPSFAALVARHSGDVTTRAVLDELERVGAVTRLKDGRVRLTQRAYIPVSDELAKLDILGTDVSDLIGAIEHNLDPARETPFYQRKVAYDHLPAEYLPMLRAHVEKSAQRLLEELNESMAREDRDVSGGEPADDRRRAMIGIYYYEDEHDA